MAEYLVLAVDPDASTPVETGDAKFDLANQITYAARIRKGDIMSVQDDGFEWGALERAPTFMRVKVPGQFVDRRYEIFAWDGINDRLSYQRKYALPIQDGWTDPVTITEDDFNAILFTKA